MKNDDEMYQSLLSRYEAYQEEKIQQKRIVRRIVPIAACFCLSVALGCSYWFHFRHIPTIPTLPETTEEQTTEQPATHPTETEANADPAETATNEPEKTTQTAPLPTDPTEPIAATAATSAPEPTIPSQPSQAAHTQTTTVPPKETTAPVDPTETVEPEPTEPLFTEPSTEQPIEPEEATESLIDGFFVENLDGCQRIIYMKPLPPKTGTLYRYKLNSDAFELVSVYEGGDVNEYRICPVGQEKEFTITQQEYEDFSMTADENAEIDVNIFLAGGYGFYVEQDNTCTVFWLVGNQGFLVSGTDKDVLCLLDIARSFVPAEQ